MRIAIALIVVLAGCSDREDVVITGIDVHDTPTGIVKQPADMSGLRVQIFAGDERLPAVPVQGDASGHIVVKGVPDGPFVVAVETSGGSRWWWSSESRDVEWHWRSAGRLDGRSAEVQQPITLAIDGLRPWTAGETLLVNSLDTATEMSPVLQPMPSVGDTSIAATFDWNASDARSSNESGRPYLMDAGDHFTLARTSSAFSNGASIVRIDQVLDVEVAMQVSGASMMIAGTMSTPEPTGSTRFTVDHPAFASTLPIAPTAPSWEIDVYQTPAWAGRWALGPAVIGLTGGDSIDGELSTQVENYPLPFDASSERWVYGRYEADTFGRTYAISMTRLDGEGYVLGPRTAFASSILLGGQAISNGNVTWDGTSPLDLAVPDVDGRVVIHVYRLVEQLGHTDQIYVGTLTSETSDLRVPADVFAIGERYELTVQIGAEDATGYAYSYSTLGPFAFSSP